MAMVSTQQKILVIKHGALGDIIQGIDAFASLRAAYPNAQISLLTTPAFKGFFADCPWFDTIYTDPRAPWWRLDLSLKMRSLFRSGLDSVIDLQCSQRTRRYHSLFFKTSKQLAGKTGNWFGDAKGCSHPIPDFKGVNNRDRMLQTIAMAGAKQSDGSIDWLLSQSLMMPPSQDFCILIPGCSAAKPSKRWPAEGFINLAKMAEQRGILPVLIGTSVDKAAIDEVHASVPTALNLMGRTSFADLIKLSSASQFIVGNDTGPVFLAARSSKPTIMVMGRDTDPAMSAPVGTRATYLRKTSIADIQADEVFEAYEALK